MVWFITKIGCLADEQVFSEQTMKLILFLKATGRGSAREVMRWALGVLPAILPTLSKNTSLFEPVLPKGLPTHRHYCYDWSATIQRQ